MYEGTQVTGLPEELRLRSLGMDGMAVENEALFSVLRSCPNLENLQLTALKDAKQIERRHDDSSTHEQLRLVVFGKPFFQRLVAFCPKIHSLDLSTYDNHFQLKGPTNQELVEAFSLFSGLKKTSLVGRSVSLDIFNTLSTYLHDTLTTLEIVDGLFSREVGDFLHGYLCDSPHLLHLKAPAIRFSNMWFDLEGILTRYGYYRGEWTALNNPNDVTDASYANASKRMIWACRNLRSLDLRFDRSDDSSAEENSRMIFSLTIRVIRRGQLKRRDLAWISDYMTPGQKLEMLVCSALYSFSRFSRIYPRTPFGNGSLTGKSSTENTVLPIAECTGKKDAEAGADYMVDGIDMRGLGRVQDVVNHATQRLKNSDQCWPHLEYLEISSEEYGCFRHEGQAEMWIKAYQPAVEVVFRRGGVKY
ncbi:hypothetical protein BGZ68_005191 [Mortierella alpina]|nr:hypothetical protein BGZ68_005191 [Mortierella alpina]